MTRKLLLDNQLCFALYSATNSITKYYNKFLSKIGITYTQYLILILLSEEKLMTIQQISNRLKLNSSTISPVLKRLLKLDLIEKNRDSKDERIVKVNLTKKAIMIEEKFIQIQKMVMTKSDLDDNRYTNLKAALSTLSNKLDDKVDLKNCESSNN